LGGTFNLANFLYSGIFFRNFIKSLNLRGFFFSKVFLDFDTQKDRILHVGDDLDRDIIGALDFGIKALWIRLPRYETTDVSELAIEGIINNITEINQLL